MRLNDPDLVRREYSNEERFAVRAAIFRDLIEGPRAEDVALAALKESAPKRVLEVGPGLGDFSERIGRELGADVTAVDLSPRMVELTRARGIDVRLGDVQDLPFADGTFDAATANWMLYHVPDLDRGLAELARVLHEGGRLVAITFSEENTPELWELLGDGALREHRFSRENGAPRLRRHFSRVEARDVEATVVFPDPGSVRRYLAATMSRAPLAERVPEFAGPLRATSRQTVFVAER